MLIKGYVLLLSERSNPGVGFGCTADVDSLQDGDVRDKTLRYVSGRSVFHDLSLNCSAQQVEYLGQWRRELLAVEQEVLLLNCSRHCETVVDQRKREHNARCGDVLVEGVHKLGLVGGLDGTWPIPSHDMDGTTWRDVVDENERAGNRKTGSSVAGMAVNSDLAP